MSALHDFTKGIVKENPALVLMLGLCPTLAVTTSIMNAVAMGAAVIGVLTCSNIIISLIRKLIPKEVRIPCFIVVIASFVTIAELLMKAYMPKDINEALGIFIPLIVVNCIILGRAEAFASKNGVFRSILDGLGMGLGFTLAVALVAACREILGNGSVFGIKIADGLTPISGMIQAPGAFLVLGLLLGFFAWLGQRKRLREV
jgi:H+/Na+-translocating ferredoxin:NAD+ oxidoreductase subunit E